MKDSLLLHLFSPHHISQARWIPSANSLYSTYIISDAKVYVRKGKESDDINVALLHRGGEYFNVTTKHKANMSMELSKYECPIYDTGEVWCSPGRSSCILTAPTLEKDKKHKVVLEVNLDKPNPKYEFQGELYE